MSVMSRWSQRRGVPPWRACAWHAVAALPCLTLDPLHSSPRNWPTENASGARGAQAPLSGWSRLCPENSCRALTRARRQNRCRKGPGWCATMARSTVGVGLVLEEASDGRIVIETVVPGGPADSTGQVRPGDTLLAIDGREVSGVGVGELGSRIVGPEGSSTVLQIGSGGRIFDVAMKRGKLSDHVDWSSRTMDGGRSPAAEAHGETGGAEEHVMRCLREHSDELDAELAALREAHESRLVPAQRPPPRPAWLRAPAAPPPPRRPGGHADAPAKPGGGPHRSARRG
jgi:hypothetical protein